MGKNAIHHARIGWTWNALWVPMTAVWLVERKQTKTYSLAFSLPAVNRVGSLHSPTLLYQQTNPYRVVAHPEPTDGFCA